MDPSDPAPSQITSVSDPYSLDPDPAKILNLGRKKIKTTSYKIFSSKEVN